MIVLFTISQLHASTYRVLFHIGQPQLQLRSHPIDQPQPAHRSRKKIKLRSSVRINQYKNDIHSLGTILCSYVPHLATAHRRIDSLHEPIRKQCVPPQFSHMQHIYLKHYPTYFSIMAFMGVGNCIWIHRWWWNY